MGADLNGDLGDDGNARVDRPLGLDPNLDLKVVARPCRLGGDEFSRTLEVEAKSIVCVEMRASDGLGGWSTRCGRYQLVKPFP